MTTSAIQSRTVPPPPALAPYVTGFLLTRITAAAPGTQRVNIFPVGHPVMSFAMDHHAIALDGLHSVATKWHITGQLLKPHTVHVAGAYSYVYVLFKPAGGYRFFGKDMGEIEDYFADVTPWLNDAHANATLEALTALGDDAEAVCNRIQEWLTARLSVVAEDAAYLLAVEACERIAAASGAITVGALCEALFVSQTKLERCFRRVVGTSPKKFGRIVRFNHAYAIIQSGAYRSWAEVVHDHAYFDQAHFIREFKGFCGFTPATLHRSVLNFAGHVVEKRAR